MVSDFDWCHDFSFEFLFRTRKVVFNFFDSDLTSPPLSFKHFRWISIAYFFFKDKSAKLNDVLFSIFSDLFHHKLFQVDNTLLSTWFGFFILLWIWLDLFDFKQIDLVLLRIASLFQRNEILVIRLMPFFLDFGFNRRLFLLTNVDQITSRLLLYFRRFFLRSLWLVLVEEKVHKFYFVYVSLIGRVKYLFRSIGIAHFLLFWFWIFLGYFLFLKFLLNNTEEISKLIVFLLWRRKMDRQKIFV